MRSLTLLEKRFLVTMQKLIYLLFSFWMIFANSCALKDLAIQQLAGHPQVTQASFPLANPDVQSSSSMEHSGEHCIVCVEADVDHFVSASEASINLLPDFPELNLLFIFFLPFWIGKENKQDFGFSKWLYSNTLNLPLYLKYQKIQLYA